MIYFFRPGVVVPRWLAHIYVNLGRLPWGVMLTQAQPAAFSGWGLIWLYRGQYHTFILWGSFISITRKNNGLVHVSFCKFIKITYVFWPMPPKRINPWRLTK